MSLFHEVWKYCLGSVWVPSWWLSGILGIVVDPLMLELLGRLRPASEAWPWVDVFQSNLLFLSWLGLKISLFDLIHGESSTNLVLWKVSLSVNLPNQTILGFCGSRNCKILSKQVKWVQGYESEASPRISKALRESGQFYSNFWLILEPGFDGGGGQVKIFQSEVV